MRIVATIEGVDIVELNDSSVTYTAKAAVDSDGIGEHHGDRTADNDTSLHWGGKPLDADVDKYIVVPPAIINGVKGVVLGCQAFVANTTNGSSSEAVVGDIGPHHKLGEVSDALAAALGLDPSPVDGGTDEHIIHYHLMPDVPAVVSGKHYTLQPS